MASNQPPPARPWFRLASQVRLEQPQPQASGRLQPGAPPPRPMFGRVPSLIPFNQPVQESPSPPPAPEMPPATTRLPSPSAGALAPEGPRAPTPPQRSSLQPVSAEPPAAAAVAESPKVIRPAAPTPPHSPRTQVLPPPSPPHARLVDRIPPATPPHPKANDEVESRLPATAKKIIDAPPTYSPPTPPRSQSFLERRNSPLQVTHATHSPSPVIEERSTQNPTPGATPPSSPPPPKRLGQPYFRRVEEDKTTVAESGSIKSGGSSKKKKPAASEAPIGAFGMLTLSGDNVGAHMELGGQRRRNSSQAEPFPGHPNRLKNEAGSNHNTALHDGLKPNKGVSSVVPMAALVNSNVQGANNSILFGSTCVHGSPGVHITLSSSTKPCRGLQPPLKATSPRTNHAPN